MWVDEENEFYNGSMNNFLESNNIALHNVKNKRNSVIDSDL